MTPRRYLSTTLTFDNRALDHTDNLQDEITALRAAYHSAKDQLVAAQERERLLILKLDAANAHNDALTLKENAGIRIVTFQCSKCGTSQSSMEMRTQEQIAAGNDGKEQA